MPETTLKDVLEAWESPAGHGDPAALLVLARQALDLGHPTLACEILRGPAARPEAPAELRYVAALALARIGSLRPAAALVEGLLAEAGVDEVPVDWLALAGRIAKDRWAALPEGRERDRAGALAVEHYRRAWQASQDVFPGINAATLLMLTGQRDAALALAGDVRVAAEAGADQLPGHWREATLGEAAVLLGDHARAAVHFRTAVALAGRQVGHVASMRRQLKLIARQLELPPGLLDALAVPSVIVFTGHVIDAPGREPPRFPPGLEAAVAARLAERLEALGAGFGYCSAASGGDLLFIEAMLARGSEVHVTLPFDRDDFIATSVAPAGGDWVARFHAALDRATSVGYGVRERFLGDESLFAHAGTLTIGAAVLQARQLETEPLMLAVVDPGDAGRTGGARDMLGQWARLGLREEIIDLSQLPRPALPAAAGPAAPPAAAVETRQAPLRRQVRTMLFADMVGYSRLAEEDTPAFLVHFLGAIAGLVQRCAHPPVFANTWGDGVYLVFDQVTAGPEVALLMRDAVLDRDWGADGLPEGTSLRIGMHTGPVFQAPDPLAGRDNFFGSHVNRAARIEPVAAAGTVYVSAEMACALAASGDRRFATDYLGVLPLAKGFGSAVLYRLRRSDEIE